VVAWLAVAATGIAIALTSVATRGPGVKRDSSIDLILSYFQ
jgi:hypothetical protein